MLAPSHLNPAFMKGFAIIQAASRLDVVAVYTAAAGQGRPVSVLEIERVPGAGILVGRPDSQSCKLPDLVVDSISRPVVMTTAGATRVDAWISNIGTTPAAVSTALLADSTTLSAGGVPFQTTAATPIVLPPPASSTRVQFIMPYYPFHPGARLDVEADYKNVVAECREDNNTRRYQAAQ
jgi:hypothetical protein